MIMILSKKQFNDYLDNKVSFKYSDMFITYDNGVYVACDDKTGNKWVEEFKSLDNAIKWLKEEVEKC